MKKGTKRLIGGMALAAGAFGAASAFLVARKKSMGAREELYRNHDLDVWARPGMMVTFRAEVMPGRDRQERTFRVKELLPSGRVTLDGAIGEHSETEFLPFR
ncbi:MAG: hypothetical protein ND895_17880 [Pyrinomonadaceae bacterium]|nr:hypothetical protein [Pyrinomonadaceae bacterium]